MNRNQTQNSCLPFTDNSPNTTRFFGNDPYQTGVAVSQAVWNNPSDPMKRPGVVILAPGDGYCFQEALISTPLIHFPRNGPVLLTEPYQLPPSVRYELLRLNPSGKGSPAQVIMVGALSGSLIQEVQMLGFSVLHINKETPEATAVAIWDVLGPKPDVLLVSMENFDEALPVAGWAAHMGDPVLFSFRRMLPPATAAAIRQRQPNVYIVGSEESVSKEVEQTVRGLTGGVVDRISGGNPFETAVNFAKYKSPVGMFGWDVNQKNGWAFTFIRSDWTAAINGAPLSHMGKHAPILLVNPICIPPEVERYLQSVNPIHSEPKPPFMHGYIIGNAADISCPVQWRLDDLLETVKE